MYCNTFSSGYSSEVTTTFSTDGFPAVIVPVLSIIRVSILFIFSNASAFLTNTPDCAPFPIPTMTDIGVAKPKAQGQAMINTAIAFTKA